MLYAYSPILAPPGTNPPHLHLTRTSLTRSDAGVQTLFPNGWRELSFDAIDYKRNRTYLARCHANSPN